MTWLRGHILPALLSVLVLVTAQAAAVAHAAPAPSGQIELCNSSGPVMVYVDAEGNPIGDPVYCPDFALSLILALDAVPVLPVPVAVVVSREDAAALVPAVAVHLPLLLRARGPPILI